MAKCGHDICPDDNCGLKHPFNGGRRARCNRIKGCIESRCSTLKALGPNGFTLFDACIGHCHDDGLPKYPGKYTNVNAYLCDNFDPVTLVEYFGVNPCGINEADTKIGKINEAENAANNQVLIGLAVVAIIIVILLLLMN